MLRSFAETFFYSEFRCLKPKFGILFNTSCLRSFENHVSSAHITKCEMDPKILSYCWDCGIYFGTQGKHHILSQREGELRKSCPSYFHLYTRYLSLTKVRGTFGSKSLPYKKVNYTNIQTFKHMMFLTKSKKDSDEQNEEMN